MFQQSLSAVQADIVKVPPDSHMYLQTTTQLKAMLSAKPLRGMVN